MTRISILDKDRCQPKKCDYLCINYCPGVRMDEDTIVIDENTKKPLISEQLCEGCGICTNRCPFDAIHIINLPEAIGEPIHRFGQNQFELFELPNLEKGSVLGLLKYLKIIRNWRRKWAIYHLHREFIILQIPYYINFAFPQCLFRGPN